METGEPDEISDLVDSHEHELRKIVPAVLEEEYINRRLTESQKTFLKSYYIDNKTDEYIKEEFDIGVEEGDDAIIDIMYFAENICGIKDIFEGFDKKDLDTFKEASETLIKKLRKGNEKMVANLEKMEKNYGKGKVLFLKNFSKIVNGNVKRKDLLEFGKESGIPNRKMKRMLEHVEMLFFESFQGKNK